MKLIPSEGKNTANYWCSWRNQRLFMPNPFLHMRLYDLEGHNMVQRNSLSDEFLFGNPGVVSHYMEDIRKDMYILLDDGWDIPYHGDYNAFGSWELNEERFPYGGKTPAENLKRLNDKIQSLGYSGTGLWVPMNCVGETPGKPYAADEYRKFWVERAKWLNEAGISYIKVDWGKLHSRNTQYREIITDVVHEYAPDVQVEHATLDGWFFDPEADRQILKDTLSVSDAYRCYDTVLDFNAVTTLGRAAAMLTLDCQLKSGCGGLINVGEEPYIAAALGCTMGIMSHPLLRGSIISMVPKDFKDGISHRATLKSEYHSFDHYVRTLRWQRIAPAFAFTAGQTVVSDNQLTDTWTYEKEPYPYYHNPSWVGKTICQSAPQIVARNTELPVIEEDKAKLSAEIAYQPYIAASKNPLTGAYTAAALQRTIDGIMNCTVPEVSVRCGTLSADCCFAAFGRFRKLTFVFDRNIEGMRLFGGDILLEDHPEITASDGVTIKANTLTLDGRFVNRLGCEAAAFDDIAEPGCVFRLV